MAISSRICGLAQESVGCNWVALSSRIFGVQFGNVQPNVLDTGLAEVQSLQLRVGGVEMEIIKA